MTTPSLPQRGIAHLPVSMFAAVMGTAGLSVAWRAAAAPWDGRLAQAAPSVATALAWVAVAVFVAVATGYAVKLIRYPAAARAELTHPVKLAFAATFSVALLVLAVALEPIAFELARWVWWVGAAAQAVITVVTVRSWLSEPKYRRPHIHPGWFIPAVGNVVAPIAGVDFAAREVVWYFFGVGVVAWLALLPIVMSRLVADEPLPPRLLPTYAIMIAPPAVASTAWVRLGGAWDDPVATILLSVAVFHAVVLATQFTLLRKAPFAPSAWAYTFPLAALTGALARAADATDCRACGWLAAAGLVAASAAVVIVGWRTVVALVRGTFLVAEPQPAPIE